MTSIVTRGPMPPDVRRRWEEAVRSVNPTQVESDFSACEAAAKEASFSGFVRRSVHRAGSPITAIADQASIDSSRLVHFLRGTGTLENQELDRLLIALGIELIGTHP